VGEAITFALHPHGTLPKTGTGSRGVCLHRSLAWLRLAFCSWCPFAAQHVSGAVSSDCHKTIVKSLCTTGL